VSPEVGDTLAGVEVGPVAHGGHFVARHEGFVVFVRGALTGEVVDVRVTEVAKRFARADVVAVHRPSPHRVEPPCPIAGLCGGCDFQHADPSHARELKRQVVAELLGHLGGVEFAGEVQDVAPSPFGWRTRMRYHFASDGRPGLRAHRSGEVVPLPAEGCRLAVPAIAAPSLVGYPGAEVLGLASAGGAGFVDAEAEPSGTDPDGSGGRTVVERAAGRDFAVAADGFWQAHSAAPAVLVKAVLDGLQPRPGERALDLYCGVGLFAGALADAGCRVTGIEGDRTAVELAARNVPSARFLSGDVARRLGQVRHATDLVVLDPPRTGAGARVLRQVAGLRPRAIAYVACDPAALGRDLRTAAELGYRPASIAAYDLFPMTHHVECVAILEPS
jgi:tRNA/tmRNA/rRNA uracil-C5-methylase (TrmA/RlmC/RlmD family)